MTLTAGRVRVAVTDDGGAGSAPRVSAGEGESGRGLLLVQAVADKWGHQTGEGRTTVWFAVTW